MALSVLRAELQLYAFEVNTEPDSNVFDVFVTWKAPAMGGYEYVTAQVYDGVAPEDVIIDTEGLLTLSSTETTAAGWTITGDAPASWIEA